MRRSFFMLKMIQCDKFIENGQIRPPIFFKSGLNTILGDEFASNSIGKSTFLMIIDFVFGGDDYIRKSIDVQKNIGPHIINFAFEFENELHYFSRTTHKHAYINICNKHYQPQQTIPKDKYTQFLSEKFKLDLPGLKLRNAISRFFRVYGRETLDPKFPLRNATQEPQKNGIDTLLKLFGHYETIKNQKEMAEKAEQEEKIFKGAQKYNYLPSVTNQEQYKKNEKRILELEKEIERLARDSAEGFASLEVIQTENASVLHRQLKAQKRQYIYLTNELGNLEQSSTRRGSLQKDYDNLQKFFPTIDMKYLEDIECFHDKIGQILKSEFKEKSASLQSMINLSAEQIAQLELQLTELGNTPNVTQAILTKYSEKQKELSQLQAGNKSYHTRIELKQKTKELKDLLDALIINLNHLAESELNGVMDEFNKLVNSKKTAPYLRIKDASHYIFSTPNDRGTGSQYKGLILFDLAILATTNLPLLVHDSVLLKQIEDSTIEKILELYATTKKQVFIVLDKKDSLPERAQNILQKTKVLHLYPNGGELFGRAWNKKD